MTKKKSAKSRSIRAAAAKKHMKLSVDVDVVCICEGHLLTGDGNSAIQRALDELRVFKLDVTQIRVGEHYGYKGFLQVDAHLQGVMQGSSGAEITRAVLHTAESFKKKQNFILEIESVSVTEHCGDD